MILHHANLAIIVFAFAFVFVVSSVKAIGHHHPCEQKCGVGKSSKSVPFPFGFSDGCGIQLNCNETVTIGGFQVQSITADNIFVDFPAECGRHMSSLYPLFGRNYAMTRNNSLLLQNCSSRRKDCYIPTDMIEPRFDLKSCDQSDSITCYSPGNSRTGLLWLDDLNRSQCKFLFSSFASSHRDDSESGVLVEFQRVILDWWLPGTCNCSTNAKCTKVELANNSSGFRCRCIEGFLGDGFAAGDGCRKLRLKITRKKRKLIEIVLATAFIVLLILGILGYLRRRSVRRRKLRLREKFLLDLMTLDNRGEAKELEIDGNKGHNLKVYSVQSIIDATNGFSSINKLGEGGFGPVYKGLLSDGREIAIKRLSGSGQGLLEFKNELILIAKLQHTNLVRLLGFCIHGEEKMLVYEYMPNKSLDFYIFDQSKRELLDWNKCFNIIEGIAQGILYLHKYSRLKIIHRDLKVGNILLDQNMNPKISDFGLARIFSSQSTNTNRIVGTYGYMSPEYAMEGIFSEKSDVYSFGVLLLEILSGRKNNSFYHSNGPLNLVGYAWQLWKASTAIELMHPTLHDPFAEDRVLRCINVALLCVEDNPIDRPSMSAVVSMLTSEIVQLPVPKQPAFCFGRRVAEVNTNEGIVAENPSINNLTMSDMDAR